MENAEIEKREEKNRDEKQVEILNREMK